MAITASTATGMYDINRISEKILLELFQVIMGWPHLRNLNAEERENFPAIDLADDINRLSIQISSTPDLLKVNKTLKTFLKHKLEQSYDRVIIYVLTERQKTYSQKSIDKVVKSQLKFCAKTDIQDSHDLLGFAATLEPARLEKAVSILRNYRLGCEKASRPTWLVNLEASRNEVQAFTPPWFLFTERKISLTGRAAEMAALEQFLGSSPSFSWWAMCGPAGMGKSRLAHELALAQTNDWYCGFINVNDVKNIDELKDLRRSALLIVDYAARDAQMLHSLLKRCCSSSPGLNFKLRILLLEREAGITAEWWKELVGENTSSTALITNHLHSVPLLLESLRNDIAPLTAAWLDAGAPEVLRLLPDADAEFWTQVAEVTEGRPLLVGLVAAAFSRAPRNFQVPALKKLLQPILRRELRRWESACNSKQEFETVKSLIALNTLLRGLPLPQKDHRIVVSTGNDEWLLIKDKHTGQLRIPSVGELSNHDEVMTQLQQRYARVLTVLKGLVPAQMLNDSLKRVMELCPVSGTLQPDLIGEYFLDELWRPRILFEADAYLQELEDDSLKASLIAAWNINALRVLETLDQLKKTTTCANGYVRALAALASVASVASEQQNTMPTALIALARLLHNTLIRVGKEKPTEDQFKLIFDALLHLKDQFPGNQDIAYRYLKSLPAFARQNLDSPKAIAACRSIVSLAPAFLNEIKNIPTDKFELFWADNLLVSALDAWNRKDLESLRQVLGSATVLYENFGHSTEIVRIVAKFFNDIAELISETRYDSEKIVDQAVIPFAKAFAGPIATAVIKCSTANNLDQRTKNLLSWTFLNISLTYSKLDAFDELLALQLEVPRVQSLLGTAIDAAETQAKLNFNFQMGHLKTNNISGAYACLDDVRALVTRSCPDEIALLCLLMIKRLVPVAIEAQDLKNYLMLVQTLLDWAPMLSQSPEIVNYFSESLVMLRSSLHSTDAAKKFHRAFENHYQTLVDDKQICPQLCIATQLNIAVLLDDSVHHGAPHLEALYHLALRYSEVRSIVDCVVDAFIRYWTLFGQLPDSSISEYGEIKVDPQTKDIHLHLFRTDRTTLTEATFSIIAHHTLSTGAVLPNGE
jgi:hypothetical protein